jgi:hypothetical protein
MNEEELIKKLEACRPGDVSSEAHRKQLKLTLVSARRSSRIGFFLVALPCLFMLGVILKYYLGLRMAAFSGIEEGMAQIDRTLFRFVPPLILVGGPLIALALNLLAIMHFQLDGPRRELQMTVKLRIVNLLICAVCAAILGMIFLYIIAENGAPGTSGH